MTRHEILSHTKALAMRHQFITAISLVVVVTCVMVSVSMTLYVLSGASGLDLSRPGFSKTRATLDDQDAKTFDATGPMEQSDIDQFKKLYAKQRNNLQGLGAFDDSTLSDESLGLTAPAESESAPTAQ